MSRRRMNPYDCSDFILLAEGERHSRRLIVARLQLAEFILNLPDGCAHLHSLSLRFNVRSPLATKANGNVGE